MTSLQHTLGMKLKSPTQKIRKCEISLIEGCKEFLPFVSKELISQEYKDRLIQTLSVFPESFHVDSFAFECPMEGESYWGDFHFRICPPYHGQAELNELFLEDIYWEKIRTVLKCEFAKIDITNLIIELDAGSSLEHSQVPNPFFSIKKAHLLQATTGIFRIFKQKEISLNTLALLQKCIRPEFGGYALGFMLARQVQAMRLMIDTIDFPTPHFYRNFLKDLGFIDISEEVDRVIEKLFPFLHKLQLEIDIDEIVLPKIGFDCYPQTSDLSQISDWEPFLSHLVKEGLIDSKRAQSLIHWIMGSDDESSGKIDLARGINHIKIVYIPGMPLRTKVYLTVRRTMAIYDFTWESDIP